jgi:prepilin-type N-terminal cleavage/methylation domain-containing protein
MMKNNKGFTILESMVAMILVSVVVGAVFSAVMAARRAIIVPSQREDIIYSVESINNILKTSASSSDIANGVGKVFGVSDPLKVGDHSLASVNIGLTADCTSKYKITDSILKLNTLNTSGAQPSYIFKGAGIDVSCRAEVL